MTKIKNFIRGDSRDIVLTFLQSDGTTPVDLTGGKVYLTLNAAENPANDANAVLQKVVTSHTDAANGITTISLGSSDTNSIAPGEYYYDAQAVDSGGNVISSKRDTWEIIPDVTRTNS